ncbi:MAG: hypothetical protein EKK71_05565 [Candidatus Competibacteraceae bacterium]|nr:MAG: hypothetical protein EKK71_05565 [Candidatus Competibacteraceae bacterium]
MTSFSRIQYIKMAGELERRLEQFAARWGLDTPKPDEQNRYDLVLDGSLRITLFQSGDQIYLESHPGSLPADPRQAGEQLGELLRKQLAGLERHEEVLSMDTSSDDLLLFRRIPARTLELADLEKAIEAFSNRLEFWARELSGGSSRQAPLPMHIVFP